MKSYKKIFVASGIFFGLGVILFAVFFLLDAKTEEALSSFEVIQGEEALRTALSGEPADYQLVDMKITGNICEDTMGVMDSRYVYLDYQKEIYRRNEITDSEGNTTGYEYKWEKKGSPEVAQMADKLYLFGDIEIERDVMEVSAKPIPNLREHVKEKYQLQVGSGNENAYYPSGIGDTLKNERYVICGIPENSNISFLAEVGDGRVVMKSTTQNGKPCMIQDGTLEDIQYEEGGEFQGFIVFMAFLFAILIAPVLAVFGVIDMLSYNKRKK